jgi:exosortase
MSYYSDPTMSAHSISQGIPLSTKIKFLILFTLWAAAFLPIYPELVRTWLKNSNNSHGLLVPLISLFFVWGKRKLLSSIKISNSNWGALILALSLVIYLLSYAGHLAVISRLMIVCSLFGLILFTLGKTIFRQLAFPLFFLLFMVPVPDSVLNLVSFPLQLFATKVSTVTIHGLSIPAYREGNMLYFAQTQLEIAEACSGIRSIIAFTMLSVIFAYLLDKGWTRRVILLASAIPLAFFANIVRVTGTGILAHFFGAKVARGFLHDFSGLAVFAFGFVLLSLEYFILNRITFPSTRPVDELRSTHAR